MKVDALATKSHYREHMQPVWDLLPERGVFADRQLTGDGPVMVAAGIDYVSVKNRPVILMEHGAGQSYSGSHAAYAGGSQRESVVLFICPSEAVAKKNRKRYPNVPAVAVGSPKMDPWHLGARKPDSELVAVCFHWDCITCPESRWAFPHYAEAVRQLAQERPVIGHAHPRVYPQLAKWYVNNGIEPVSSLDEVFARASVMVADNTSAAWEFMSLDRPVVWLNAPWYRRRANHGMRFWDFADSGVQVNEPGELSFAIAEALMDTTPQQRRRREVIQQVYERTDGKAALRAAEAIAAL